MKTIVFFGDSITDAGRVRESERNKGHGYVNMISGALGAQFPKEYCIYNRGISGNRIIDLLARIKAGVINLSPDFVSILIGINDVWHEYNKKNGVDAPLFEAYYDMLIEQLKNALPNVKIVILSPFVLPGSATESNVEHPDRWDFFQNQVPLRIAAAKRIAQKHGLSFVPLQETFDKACEKAEPTWWLHDGVHPTDAGADLIKQEWLKVFQTL